MEEENKDNEVGAEATTENTGANNATETKIDYAEMMKTNKEFQSFVDSQKTQAIQTAVANAKAKWEEESRTKQAEAEKLAKMDEDQKRDYELEQWKQRAEKAERQNAIDNLRAETIKQASEKGILLEFVSTLNFEYETAETIKSKLEALEKAVKKEREIAINEYSKETPPQTGDKVDSFKPESQMTYEELCKLPKYKN